VNVPPIQYVTTNDGFDIAYVTIGQGPALVMMPFIFSNLQDFGPLGRNWVSGLAQRFRTVVYDSRGHGMSSRGLAETHTMADYTTDLEAVLATAGIERCLLLGRVQSVHTAARYAVEHPERVAGLILVSGYIDIASWPQAMMRALPGQNWDLFLTSIFPSGLPLDALHRGVEAYRSTVTQQDYETAMRAISASNIENILPEIEVPTLVLHARDFKLLAQEEGRKLAARIKGARFAVVEGRSLLPDAEPGLRMIDEFLKDAGIDWRKSPTRAPSANLSSRESEVLRLVAAGKSNQEIADELVISLNTVGRHVSNIFDKTGATNRVEASVWARDHGLT
jgi:pimeloyl-ACP methyl ester carboxylesterase/DNA-binding CsgD family transcriptional regulator